MRKPIKYGSLFTGAGGFDLGFDQVGFKCQWQCEINKIKRKTLEHWNVPIYSDATENNPYTPVDIICGGDPCPIRSRARSNGKSKSPDLSGYFLAVVGRMRPRWVVRENVPASDVTDFTAALEILGYRVVIIRANADSFTAQRRIRDFIVGCNQETWPGIAKELCNPCHNTRYHSPRLGTGPYIPCLTTHRTRYDSRDCYIFDGKLRVLDGEERAAFAGFPGKRFAEFSETAVAKITGDAVVVPVAHELGKIIKKAESRFMTKTH